MSLRLSRGFKGAVAVAALVWGGLGAPAAWAQGQSARPEAEAPSPQAGAGVPARSVRSRPPLRKNGLLRLEEQLSHSFEFLKPKSSAFDTVRVPPMRVRPAAPILSRRAKEQLDEKKNWMFRDLNDLTAGPKAEDLFDLPEGSLAGAKSKSLSPIERFYKNLDQRNSLKDKAHNPMAEAEELRRLHEQITSSEDPDVADPNVPEAIRDRESTLRKLLGLDDSRFAPAPVQGSFSDVFGFGEKPPTKEQEEAHKAYIAEFNEWLNRSTPTAPSSGLVLPPGATDPTRPTPTATASYSPFTPFNPSGRPNNYDPSIGVVNPTLAVTAPEDITTKVLNQWNPYYVPPKVEPPKYQPPEPVFDVPRRKF